MVIASARPIRGRRSKMRYTHRLTISSKTNTVFSGAVAVSMVVPSTLPSTPFFIEVNGTDINDIAGIKIIGTVSGSSVTENFTITEGDVKYSTNNFTSIQSLSSRSFRSGDAVSIFTVDSAYQPIYWDVQSGPYECIFSTTDGMSAGMRQELIGLNTIMNHYVRLPYTAPVSKNMEFTISPGYDGKVFVPITDFDIVCIPPKFIPIEWAFRCTEKMTE